MLYNDGNIKGLRIKRNLLEDELTLASSILVASNDELDIYEQNKYQEQYIYYIVLHNTYEIVGYIRTDYEKSHHVFGNVGYEIFEKYRGNGYSKKSLELLCDVFIERGMDEATIVIKPDNIASIKTAEYFGGVIAKKDSDCIFNIYNVDLKQKIKSRKNN